MTLPPSIETVTVVADFRTAITGSGVGGSVRFSLIAPRQYPTENITLVASETFPLVDGQLEPTEIPKGEYIVAEQFIGGRRYVYNFQDDLDLTDILNIDSSIPDYELLARGPAGPTGPPGTGTAYTHTQEAASASWSVTHNLGHYPTVAIISDAGELVHADVALTINTATITFATPTVGTAVFV